MNKIIFFQFVVAVSGKFLPNFPEKRLIKTNESDPGNWMTNEEIFGLIKSEVKFVDISELYFSGLQPESFSKQNEAAISRIPSSLHFQSSVQKAIDLVDMDRVYQFMQFFTSFTNRYCDSLSGGLSQKWLLLFIYNILEDYSGNAFVEEINHGFPQQTIIVRLEGSDPELQSEIVILGAHLDSINRYGSKFPAPGADDNASGTATILETLRAIVDAGLIPRRTLQFHFYAAEEIGFVGSIAVALKSFQEDVDVVAMLNLDVVSYRENGVDEIGIYTDFGDEDIHELLRLLTDDYLDFGWRDRTCGYGCSDHASWNLFGYPSAMAAEVKFHPKLHTPEDTMDYVDMTQVKEFIKLAISFAVEVAEMEAK